MLPQRNNNLIFQLVIVLSLVGAFFYIKHLYIKIPSSRLTALDRLRPETFRYIQDPDSNRQKIYQTYFDAVYKTLGSAERPEILGLLGYCAYQRHDLAKAEAYYLKAREAIPDFFWYSYNLGIIYLKQQRFDEAEAALVYAINLQDMTKTIVNVFSSRQLYFPITVNLELSPNKLAILLQRDYERAQQLIVMAHLKTVQPELLELTSF